MAEALVAAGYPPAPIEVATGGKANGEAHEIEVRGGRYVSLIGNNPWFHATAVDHGGDEMQVPELQ
jgi:hypothetical protein